MSEQDVDFVADGSSGDDDEDLPQHRSRLESWRPQVERFLRGRYGLPLVVVLVVLALLVGRALLHEKPSGAPPSSASPTSSASSTTPASGGGTVAVDPGNGRAAVALPRRAGTDPTRCPGLQCYTSTAVPDAVRAAVRAVFPAATFTATETIRLNDQAQGNPLWYREVDARIGSGTLTVRVQAHADGDTTDGTSNDDGHQSVTNLDAPLQDWFVRVRVTDRSGTGEPFDQLSALVADARLLQV